jgi:hypothetical protein
LHPHVKSLEGITSLSKKERGERVMVNDKKIEAQNTVDGTLPV